MLNCFIKYILLLCLFFKINTWYYIASFYFFVHAYHLTPFFSYYCIRVTILVSELQGMLNNTRHPEDPSLSKLNSHPNPTSYPWLHQKQHPNGQTTPKPHPNHTQTSPKPHPNLITFLTSNLTPYGTRVLASNIGRMYTLTTPLFRQISHPYHILIFPGSYVLVLDCFSDY